MGGRPNPYRKHSPSAWRRWKNRAWVVAILLALAGAAYDWLISPL